MAGTRRTTIVSSRARLLQEGFSRYSFSVVRCDSSNLIADAVTNGALKSDANSGDAKAIADLLSRPGYPYAAVLGNVDSVAVATLSRALADSKGKARSRRTALFVGNQQYETRVKAAALDAGFDLKFVAFPN